MDIASRGRVAIDSRSSSSAALLSSPSAPGSSSTSIDAAYRRVVIVMLGLDVATLAEQLGSTRAEHASLNRAA